MYGHMKLSQDGGKEEDGNLELDFWDLEIVVVHQVEAFPSIF